MPTESFEAVIRAFDDHDVVCLGEAHGLRALADFAFALFGRREFVDVVDDIVVECGNRRYQEVADRFTAGEELSPALLLPVLQNTTQPGAWDAPMYGQILVRVREVNRTLPPERHLRVLLGDVAVDWAAIRAGTDYAPYAAIREAHFAGVIESEVLKKGRKALFWAGASHVVRKPASIPNPVVLLERRGTKPFVILAHPGFVSDELESRLAAFHAPSLLRLKDTWLGRLDAALYFRQVKTPNPYLGTRLEETADAYLHLGARNELLHEGPPEDLYNGAYGDEVRRRRGLIAELWKKV